MNNKKIYQILNEIKRLTEIGLAELNNNGEGVQNTKQGKNMFSVAADPILQVVNKIKDCDETEKIEKEILDKNSIQGRVLLPFYICYKYFSEQGLTTGDIEKITSELRVRIQTANVSNAISGTLQKYLEGDSTRVKGRPVFYKMNRKGAAYFETLLKK